MAAHYLLTMLAESDPRGFPGLSVASVQLQRAGEGHPLDDVIVRGTTRNGEDAALEIQVKRTIKFSPGDPVFKDVVGQLAKAYRSLDLSNQRRQFAVATERTSFRISGPYQDLLRWAREVSSEAVFFGRIGRKNVGNDDMRSFVETMRTHLKDAGCAFGDEAVWQLARRFWLLTFDFDAPGSQSLELALERARSLLSQAHVTRAKALWSVLTETAIRVAASGGDLDRVRLLTEIEGFPLRGLPRNEVPRETLAEGARLAVADLRRNVAEVTLPRSALLGAARNARDQGRYLEIRGGPGVGKSGLLGMLVDEVLTEARAIVITPDRIVPGGWLALKSVLQVEGGLESFLHDLASDGGAVLFIDSLDFFNDSSKRATVIDLVRSAAATPGFQVIVTARTDFDKDEPNWLPADVLAKLGGVRAVVIDELEGQEIEELKAAAPSLRAILDDDHPAREVARNLFRLSRLLEVEGSIDQLRSEVDLLDRWWSTADGPLADRRERKRLLADLADTLLEGGDHLAARTSPSAVDALVASGTLRELSLDRVVFRHEVLRDWSVAARLHDNRGKMSQLPLTRAAPAALARGVELGARLSLERADEGRPWLEYLCLLSPKGSHASWRRWAVLAILRSELAYSLLDRALDVLAEDDGALLRELIRTTLAAESRPLVEILAKHGVDVTNLPTGLDWPSNASWSRLSNWLLARRDRLPLQVLPDVVELFQNLSASMFFEGPLTEKIAVALADWLDEIESALDRDSRPEQARFAGEFAPHELQKLASDMRRAFFLTAASTPQRAQAYLRRLAARTEGDQSLRDVMKFRGSLAKAAPAELSSVTLTALISKDSRGRGPGNTQRAFTYLDNDFLPSSPAQGPFLELLNAAPEHGLKLIHQLVDHAISARTKGRQSGADSFTLVLPGGPRSFPWQRSYYWSRQADGCYAVESALLALEAWSHKRIERGDAPNDVISDVLGPPGSPAAFLLVAVDVLISHWPKTMATAVPFLGSPELLAVDRTRQAHDGLPGFDLGGWSQLPKVPAGTIRASDLKKRGSRRFSLEALLPAFALEEFGDRAELQGQLAAESAKLGPPQSDDTFADPRFMARFALNRIDPANWRSEGGAWTYVSPPEESSHIEALQRKNAAQFEDFRIDAEIQNVLEDSKKSSATLAERAVAYAQRLAAEQQAPEDSLRHRTNTIVSAAMMLTRDGSDALVDQHEGWAREVFGQAFASDDDNTVSQTREGIRFNPISIAALGLIHLWRRRGRKEDRDALLTLAGHDEPYAAQGFGAGLATIREIEPRLLLSLMRCALAAQVHPAHEWDDPEEARKAAQGKHREEVAATIREETAWLDGIGPEPSWPALPPLRISVSRGIRLGPSVVEGAEPPRPEQQFDSQSGALWLRQLTGNGDAADPAWLASFVDSYAEWTAAANGAGLSPTAEIGSRVDQWNAIFFEFLAIAFAGMAPEKVDAHVARAAGVPDRSYFEVASELVPAIDRAFFNGRGLDLRTAVRLRATLAERLIRTNGWRWERDKSELSVETRIGPAIAAVFFNQYGAFAGASSYLLAKGIDQVDPFLPVLERLVEEGPVPFIGILTMNLLEVSPKPGHLKFFLSSVLTWLRRQPTNTKLWVDHGLGTRASKWLADVMKIDPSIVSSSSALRPEIDDALARLVQIGVAAAHRLEQTLETVPEGSK